MKEPRKIESYPRLHNQLVRQHGSITSLIRYAETHPPMNADQFWMVANAALKEIESAIQFLDDGLVEDAAICAIHAAEYLEAAGCVTGLPLAKTGRKVMMGGIKGHEKTYGAEEDKLKRNAELQSFIEGLKKQHPDITSHTALCNLAAQHKDCPHTLSGRRMRDNTRDPYK